MSESLLMFVTIFLPLLAVVPAYYYARKPRLRDAAIGMVSALSIALIWFWACRYFEVNSAVMEWVQVAPGIAVRFMAEPLGLVFALMVTTLWLVATLYTHGYLKANKEKHKPRFLVCYAGSISAALGLAFAANLFTMFLFYEALTLITYPLVVHYGDAKSRAAGRTYLQMLLGTSLLFLFPAMVAIYALAGTLEFTLDGVLAGKASPAVTGLLLLLMVYGCGKAALMPLHRWLPAAMVAPAPVSALLHAVAVVKAGVFCILKILVYVFGLTYLQQLVAVDFWAGGWLVWLASMTVLAASLMAMKQNSIKLRLAYSTISQLGYMVMVAGLFTPAAITAVLVFMVAHALAKITLFFAAGAIATSTGKYQVSDLAGLGRVMPWTMGAFTIAALALIGLPPTLGFFAKYQMLQESALNDHFAIILVMVLGTILSAAYLLPMVFSAWFGGVMQLKIIRREAPLSMRLAMWASTLLALFSAAWLLTPMQDLTARIDTEEVSGGE